MRPGSRFRVSVPDGFFPSEEYINHVKPGGTGPGASDHKVLYDYKKIEKLLGNNKNFDIVFLEFWDEFGNITTMEPDDETGKLIRTAKNDLRNSKTTFNYTSLVFDIVIRA